jgi:hypothetical protein
MREATERLHAELDAAARAYEGQSLREQILTIAAFHGRGMNARAIARRLGLRVTDVRRKLAMVQLPAEVIESIEKGHVEETTAIRALRRAKQVDLDPDARERLFERARRFSLEMQRRHIPLSEQGKTVLALYEAGLPTREMRDAMGKSLGWMQARIALGQATAELQAAVEEGLIPLHEVYRHHYDTLSAEDQARIVAAARKAWEQPDAEDPDDAAEAEEPPTDEPTTEVEAADGVARLLNTIVQVLVNLHEKVDRIDGRVGRLLEEWEGQAKGSTE